MITAGDFSTCATSSTRTRPYAAWERTILQLRGCVRATLDRLDSTRRRGCLITASAADRPATGIMGSESRGEICCIRNRCDVVGCGPRPTGALMRRREFIALAGTAL